MGSIARFVDKLSVALYQYPVGIKALASGAIDVSGVVSDEYRFEDLAEALRVNIENKSDVVKIVIKIG
jgi:L-iditol 2-dehydrogenase